MTEPSSSVSFRRLGRSGLTVSTVGLGTNNFGMKLDLAQSRAVVHAALDHGITLFDTSDSYGDSEERLGESLQGNRDDVVIATKFGNDVRRSGQDNGVDWGARGSRRYIRRAVEFVTALAHRLDRPVPDAPARSFDADGGDIVRAR